MNVTRKITYIEELTYGMVNAEGKRNLEKFKHHFFVINMSMLMNKKPPNIQYNTIQSSGHIADR